MATYKNKNYKTRNYECTNVIFCEAENAPNENWIEQTNDEFEIEMMVMNVNHLYTQNGVRFFGYL